MKNTAISSNKKIVNAYRLAQMTGTHLSISGFKHFLGRIKCLNYKDSTTLIESLYSYLESQPLMDFQFKRFDVPYLTVLVDKLNQEITTNNQEGKKINVFLTNQRDSIISWVDYILYANNLPAPTFTFKEAKKVYIDYKNSRNSLNSNMAA